jgi:hypothetical protein
MEARIKVLLVKDNPDYADNPVSMLYRSIVEIERFRRGIARTGRYRGKEFEIIRSLTVEGLLFSMQKRFESLVECGEIFDVERCFLGEHAVTVHEQLPVSGENSGGDDVVVLENAVCGFPEHIGMFGKNRYPAVVGKQAGKQVPFGDGTLRQGGTFMSEMKDDECCGDEEDQKGKKGEDPDP